MRPRRLLGWASWLPESTAGEACPTPQARRQDQAMSRTRQRKVAATMTVRLRAGRLSLFVDEADWDLDELCGFASRRSRKRGFLFVSRVPGKHLPVQPSVMDHSHRELAIRLTGIKRPVVAVGLAETATALGQAVFEHLLTLSNGDDLLFLHTTRYRLDRPVALRFDEAHSHAPDQLLYEPAHRDDLSLFRSARSLV